MTMLMTAAVLAAGLAMPAGASAAPPQVPQTEGHFHQGELGEKYLLIEQRLKCNCGCGLDVHSCQFQMQCGTSPVWSARIRESLERGMTQEEIEAAFVAEYGPSVLMAPPAEGFNLVGYLLPSFAIVAAGALIGLFVIRRRPGREAPAPVTELSEEAEARLREEMRRIEEAESPDW